MTGNHPEVGQANAAAPELGQSSAQHTIHSAVPERESAVLHLGVAKPLMRNSSMLHIRLHAFGL